MWRSKTKGAHRLGVVLVLAGFLTACGEDETPMEPGLDVALVAGTYTMTALRFDPQGSLPENNLLALIPNAPQLNLTSGGQAQIVYRDPVTTLVVTIQGTFETTRTGVRIDFPSESGHAQLLLPDRVEFTFSEAAETVSFSSNASVSRARLIELVPTLANEQLLDPTPGLLTVTFTRD